MPHWSRSTIGGSELIPRALSSMNSQKMDRVFRAHQIMVQTKGKAGN